MTYTVQYKLPGQWWWRTVRRVRGDLVATDVTGGPRVLILEDESRIEIPLPAQFRFSRERFLVIRQQMEQEAGQSLPVGGVS